MHLLRLTLLFLFLVPAAVSRAAERPNVILFFSDDQGTLDLNCYGSTDLKTPHLDELARKGLRFTQFYTASPVCSPSRAALLTGRHPIRAGLNTNAPNYPGHPGMPTDEVTLAELLKSAGYQTAIFGKWHLGTTPECEPLGQGFDQFFGHKSGCIDNYSHFFYWQEPHVHDLWENEKRIYLDGQNFISQIVGRTKQFLTKNRRQPFFLYIPFNIPHYPMQPPEKFRKMYESLPEPRRSYAASVSAMDEAIGEVLGKLKSLGLERNTLVIFLSDHGHSTEPRANFGGGNAGPFRGSKFSLLEGGIRVPCIISWPGTLPQNETRGQLGMAYDLFPTLAELCKAPLPQRKLDGKSLVPVLRDGSAPSPHELVHWKLGDQWAVRQGPWKLVHHANDTKMGTKIPDRLFLSNMDLDQTETRNLAREHPDIVTRLTELHETWAKEVQQR